jgi:hypothetical protein
MNASLFTILSVISASENLRLSEWINVMGILFIEQYLENVTNKWNLSNGSSIKCYFIFNQISFIYEKEPVWSPCR